LPDAPTTLVMLLIRPKRCFIIGRMAARLAPNTAFRLVPSTASQSSSFMRMARVSRVIPALLTSTCRPPWVLTRLSISASTAAPLFTSSATPREPAKADSACEILAAPSSVVAVPITW